MEEMNQEPRCPWCGEEMKYNLSSTWPYEAYYICTSCEATGPFITGYESEQRTESEAYRRTISRPLGKPMTWEQVKQWQHDWIFVEFHLGDVFAMMPYINKFQPMTLDVYVCDKEGYETYGPYGDGFRCWDHYPTDEERSAAPWNP